MSFGQAESLDFGFRLSFKNEYGIFSSIVLRAATLLGHSICEGVDSEGCQPVFPFVVAANYVWKSVVQVARRELL